jgi:hypothetical protein
LATLEKRNAAAARRLTMRWRFPIRRRRNAGRGAVRQTVAQFDQSL